MYVDVDVTSPQQTKSRELFDLYDLYGFPYLNVFIEILGGLGAGIPSIFHPRYPNPNPTLRSHKLPVSMTLTLV